uniref:Uncharacterized protein n=1 Tax=viral metagenome TaxID=1070528 RepID=A0A6C0M290_9ZZZZ
MSKNRYGETFLRKFDAALGNLRNFFRTGKSQTIMVQKWG